MAFQFRRGTDAERQSITPKPGEPLYVTDTGQVYVGDGTTQGGNLVSISVSDDDSPSLGSNLDLNGNDIVGTGNINIDGFITATGNINLGDGAEDNVIVGGVISSSLIPSEDGRYDLGDVASRWRNGFFEGAEIGGELFAGSLRTGSIYSQDSSTIYDAELDAITVSSITSDLVGSVFGDDSTTLVDGLLGELNTNLLNLSLNTISTSQFDGEINFACEDNTERLRINYLSNQADFTLKDFGITDGRLAPGTFFNTQRNNLENPQSVQAGDPLSQFAAAGWDGDTYVSSSIIIQSVDQYESVSNGFVPGTIKLYTFNTDSLDISDGKGLEIDSRGFVGILNDSQPEAALDVNGSAIVRGSVTSNLIGSVFSDNSTEMIDGVAGEIVGPVRNLTVLGNTGTPSNTDGLSPSEWLEVSVNGSTRYIPLYT